MSHGLYLVHLETYSEMGSFSFFVPRKVFTAQNIVTISVLNSVEICSNDLSKSETTFCHSHTLSRWSHQFSWCAVNHQHILMTLLQGEATSLEWGLRDLLLICRLHLMSLSHLKFSITKMEPLTFASQICCCPVWPTEEHLACGSSWRLVIGFGSPFLLLKHPIHKKVLSVLPSTWMCPLLSISAVPTLIQVTVLGIFLIFVPIVLLFFLQPALCPGRLPFIDYISGFLALERQGGPWVN